MMNESFPDVLSLDDCGEENVSRWIKTIKSTLESFVNCMLPWTIWIAYQEIALSNTWKKNNAQSTVYYNLSAWVWWCKKRMFYKDGVEGISTVSSSKDSPYPDRRVQWFYLDFPGSKELKISLDPSKMEDDNVMQGTLLSNILIKMAEMFIKSNK